jgi:hypothetical protein
MRHAVGDAAFQKICAERMPEGRRLEILGPLLAGGESKPIHTDTPHLLRATILAQCQLPEMISAYQASPSALLLVSRSLPVSRTNLGIGLYGWMTTSPEGLEINNSSGQVTLSANGTNLKSIPLPEAPNSGALLEKMSKALLSADFSVTDQIAKKIEGGAVDFQTTSASKKQ